MKFQNPATKMVMMKSRAVPAGVRFVFAMFHERLRINEILADRGTNPIERMFFR
jgi:hypothetical protein